MKIYAVSTPAVQKAPAFEANKKSKKVREDNFEQPYANNRVSNSALRNALKGAILIPTAALTMASCDKDVEIYDTCGPTIIWVNKPNKPTVPPTKDTLYTGHIYNLEKVSVPVRDSEGNKINSITIPAAQAYIPRKLADSPVKDVMNSMFNRLGIITEDVAPAEGKNQAVVDNLPLQMIYSNPKTKTVTALNFDGFNSSDKSFAFDAIEYKNTGSIKSSTHYDFTYLDGKSLFVEKYDNFAPDAGRKTEILQIDGSSVQRLINIGENKYSPANTYTKGDLPQSIFIDSENSSSEITDIKVKSSSL